MLQLKTLKLVRSTSQSISNNTEQAISWNSAEINTGPASWWSPGSPTQIVMPWAGLYLMTFHCSWASSSAGIRLAHLNQTTTISAANQRTGTGLNPNGHTDESNAYLAYTMVVNVPAAGTVYVKTVFQNSGAALDLRTRVGQIQPATLTFAYLDG